MYVLLPQVTAPERSRTTLSPLATQQYLTSTFFYMEQIHPVPLMWMVLCFVHQGKKERCLTMVRDLAYVVYHVVQFCTRCLGEGGLCDRGYT